MVRRMEKDEFLRLAEQYRTIPVYQRVLADLLTPVSAYMSLQKNSPYAFILESVEKGTQYARYSYVGINPKLVLEHRAGVTTVHGEDGKLETDEPFLSLLRNTKAAYATVKLPGLPSLSGGLVGYLGYETITWVEDVPVRTEGDMGVPDAVFMLFEELVAFDHLMGQIVIFCNVPIDYDTNLHEAFAHAHERIDVIRKMLQTNVHPQTPIRVEQSELHSNLTKSQFHAVVQKAKDYITTGDAFQIVPVSGEHLGLFHQIGLVRNVAGLADRIIGDVVAQMRTGEDENGILAFAAVARRRKRRRDPHRRPAVRRARR